MGLRGVGIDIVDVSRMRRVLNRHGARFERRWFAPEELSQHGDRAICLARSYAVKEAVRKALAAPTAAQLPWCDIVAIVDGDGSVTVTLRGDAARGQRAVHATVAVQGSVVIAAALVE